MTYHPLTRRQFLRLSVGASGLAIAGLAGCAQPASQAEPLEQLVIKGPPAPPSILLARITQQERLNSLVPEVMFDTWANPDQLRADVTANALHVAATPTNVAANLYNRGVPVRLLNVNVWGILYVLTVDERLTGWDDLRGQTIAVPFQGDMPDLTFRYLAAENNLDAARDMTLQYVAAPIEGLQSLLAGRVQAAVLPEPAATAAQLRGNQEGITIRRMLNLQEQWAAVTGQPPRIPQAGTLAVASLVEQYPDVVAAVQEGLTEAVAWTNQNPEAAAQLGVQHLGGIQEPIIIQSLPRMNLEMVPAAEARAELEFFFSRLSELSPEVIGGALPDDGFYYTA
jgi:NitT/TauT family transport system substrate-binding protein